MGNGMYGLSMMKTRRTKPRVVLEAPHYSNTDTTQPRVTFANKRTGNESFKARPQMTDVGNVHATDIYQGGTVASRYQRTQSNRLGSNLSVNDSFTSVRSTASGPVDGVWEPTLNPYDGTNNLYENETNRITQNGDVNLNALSFNRYVGFTERDYRYGTRIDNGLAKVDEI